MVSAVASQQEGPGFESRPFCVELACSSHVCVGFLRVLRFPLTCILYSCHCPVTKALALELELVPGRCTVAAHCS